VVTNVGMFGIDTSFAPFLPIARCPMLVLVTEVKERPVVESGSRGGKQLRYVLGGREREARG
jgi:hypothetical protein